MYVSPWLPLLELYYQHIIENENSKKSLFSPPTSPNQSQSSQTPATSPISGFENENQGQSFQSPNLSIDSLKLRKRCNYIYLFLYSLFITFLN